MDNLTPEEKQVRLKKADSIRRMLAEQSSVQSGHRNTGIVVYIYSYSSKIFFKRGRKKRSPDIYVGFSPWIYGFGKESPHKESGQKS